MQVIRDGVLVDLSPEEEEAALNTRPAELLVAYAAAKRYTKEVGGINVGGANIATDDRSKLMIVGAATAAQLDPEWTTNWKLADGSFVPVNAAQILAIAQAVSSHVSACFSIEQTVRAGIESEDITSYAEIDTAFA